MIKPTTLLSSCFARAQRALRPNNRRQLSKQLGSLAALVLFLNWNVTAVMPPAGTSIGNQATATYEDSSGTQRTAFSNVAQTFVQQVASLTLDASQSKSISPGGQVSFPHTLVNTGNGSDSFTLASAASSGFAFGTVEFFADANGDGVPDNSTAITTTPSLAAGATFKFVVVATAPASVSAGQSGAITVTARSAFDNTVVNPVANTDTATVSGGAVINLTKAISASSGASPSGPYTYTLTYNNSGNTAGTNLTIVDVIPAGMTYVAGSARWSVSGGTALNDLAAAGNDPAGINFDAQTIPGTLTFVVTNIAPGQAGTLTFQVNVNTGLPAGNIDNTATYSYYDGSNPTPQTGLKSNPARFTVLPAVSVTLTGQTIASALQGATVSFTNVVHNTGSGIDTFNITFSGSTFPTGTSFVLFGPDGNTPLQDSNGDGVPDTGPMAPNATYNVIIKAVLPPNATGGPFVVNKKATSTVDPSVSATCTDQLTAISSNSVDIVASATYSASALGYGAGPEVSPVQSVTTNPGQTVVLTNYINNTGLGADTYDLSVNGLPSGWSVTFKDGSGTTITSSGLVAPGATKQVLAYITLPAGVAPSATQLQIRAVSPTSGAADAIHDEIVVTTVRNVSLTPNNTGQIFPGGALTYVHTLQNNGNVTEGGTSSRIDLTLNIGSGWTAVVYQNMDGSGVLKSGDPIVTSISSALAPGASINLIVKVYAPAGAAAGSQQTATLTATTVNTGASTTVPAVVAVTDTTTVIASLITLTKEQGLDATCSGTIASYATANIAAAKPGACIGYRLTAMNIGTMTATNIVINDTCPAFTTFKTGSLVTPDGSATLANGTSGHISVRVDTLAPGQSAVVTFEVKIDQ